MQRDILELIFNECQSDASLKITGLDGTLNKNKKIKWQKSI